MAKFPEKIVFGFDPTSSNIPALKTWEGVVVWGVIRNNHIVTPSFEPHCLEFVKSIRTKPPIEFTEFYQIAVHHRLDMFGTRCIKEGTAFRPSVMGPDMEWWKGLFDVLFGDRPILIEVFVPGKERKVIEYPYPEARCSNVVTA